MKNIRIKDISILDINGKHTLVLICETTQTAADLLDYIMIENPVLNVTIDKEGVVFIHLDFERIGCYFKVNSYLTREGYPPFEHLFKGRVTQLTTGVDNDIQLLWSDRYHPIGFHGLN